jgi:hypothetical protein
MARRGPVPYCPRGVDACALRPTGHTSALFDTSIQRGKFLKHTTAPPPARFRVALVFDFGSPGEYADGSNHHRAARDGSRCTGPRELRLGLWAVPSARGAPGAAGLRLRAATSR